MAECARDVMQTDILTVAPETPLIDVQRMLIEEEIGGAPVVDEEGIVRGVITLSDLIRAVGDDYGSGSSAPVYYRESLEFSGPDWAQFPEDFQDRLGRRAAEDVMSSEVVSVSPDTPVSGVARTLREHRIHRVLVVADATLVGIISSLDLVRLLERS